MIVCLQKTGWTQDCGHDENFREVIAKRAVARYTKSLYHPKKIYRSKKEWEKERQEEKQQSQIGSRGGSH